MQRSGAAHDLLLCAAGALPRAAARRGAAACATLALLAALGGCARHATVQPVLSERCLQLGGARQEITVQVPLRGTGLLHVRIRERGISIAARIEAASRTGDPAESPFRHWGGISLATDVTSASPTAIRISSVDTPGATGEVCLSAELIRPGSAALVRAAQLSFRAGVSTHRRKWQDAFDGYLAAARLYDSLHMRRSSADARTAMAQLAHTYLRRDRDSVALLGAVVARSSGADAESLGARLDLLANALVERPEESNERIQRIDELLNTSQDLFKSSAGGARELPRITILRGFLTYRNHEPNESRRLFTDAANECERLHDSDCYARARQNLAAIAEDQQDYPQALADYESALRALDESRLAMLAADISDNLGRLEGRVGLIQRGEAADLTAMRLYARLGDCDGARRAASTLGEMLARIGSIGEAAIYLNEATELKCHDLLSVIHGSSSRAAAPPVAVAGFRSYSAEWGSPEATRVCPRHPPLHDLTLDGDVAVFHALLAGADIAQFVNQLADADRCLRLARDFAVDVRRQIRLENAGGQLLLRKGDPAAARAAFSRALRLAEGAELSQSSEYSGTALLGLTDAALQTRDSVDALADARMALRLSSKRADMSRVVAALRLIATIDRQSGQRAAAQRLLQTAIRLIEQVPTERLDPETRAMYLATQHATYAELTDLLVDEAAPRNHPAEDLIWSALSVADEGHARSLRYALDQASLVSSPAKGDSATRDYRRLMLDIAGLASDAPTAPERGNLLERIQRLSLAEPETVTLAPPDLTRTLGRMRATLVEYAAGRDSLFAFVVDGEQIHVIDLGELEPIDQAASGFIAQLRSPEPDANRIRTSALRLAKLVLWPITPYIRRERIFLVPEDELHTVPFAAMPWSSTDSRDLLLRHAEISILPSALFIERQWSNARRGSGIGRFVLIGDPVLRGNVWERTCVGPDYSMSPPYSPFDWMRSLPTLPGTRDEVLAVAKIVRRARSPASVLTLLGCSATPAALRANAPDAEVVHLATHGLVDARRPRLSTLVLTPDAAPADDGAVQLLDILGMKLRAHLVVLSACDTSAGRLLPGEGVLGLAQAFLQSGAESVVASFWRVEDRKTATFMERFYRHLLFDRLSAAAALRRAQLDMSSTDDDYNWAAFALYGYPDSAL